MKVIRGKYSEAKVFTDNIDDVTVSQIEGSLNEELTANAQVRIMRDCHAGKGAVIGTTMKVIDRVVPNLVGVDIGCGMLCLEVQKQDVDFAKLDAAVKAFVPSGQSIRTAAHDFIKHVELDRVLANFFRDTAAGTTRFHGYDERRLHHKCQPRYNRGVAFCIQNDAGDYR